MRKTSLVALLVAAALLVPLVVFASHQFNDVPDGHTFHNAIAWMKDNNITVGCNPPANTNYCPDDFVTRGQMAAFMKRLAENRVVDAATANLNVGQVDLTADEHTRSPLAIGAFVPTGSSAPCLLTLAESPNAAFAGTTAYCGVREVAGVSGVFIHILLDQAPPAAAIWTVNIYQDGVANYGDPQPYAGL